MFNVEAEISPPSIIGLTVNGDIIDSRIREILSSLGDVIQDILNYDDNYCIKSYRNDEDTAKKITFEQAKKSYNEKREDVKFQLEKAIQEKAEEIASDLLSDFVIDEVKKIINNNKIMKDFIGRIYMNLQNMYFNQPMYDEDNFSIGSNLNNNYSEPEETSRSSVIFANMNHNTSNNYITETVRNTVQETIHQNIVDNMNDEVRAQAERELRDTIIHSLRNIHRPEMEDV